MTYRHLFALAGALVLASSVSSQTRPDLFQCDGCEAINDRSHVMRTASGKRGETSRSSANVP